MGIEGIEIGRLRGSGGFADVYEANEAALSRLVAVKLFRTRVGGDDRRSFEREARAMGRLSGIRNVVQVYRSGVTDDDHPYLVVELMDGSLEEQLRDQPLPAADVCRAGVLVGRALMAAHDEGILHRDIKPANILIDRYGEPALSDFGIAALADSGTNSFVYAFTAEHAAPEVFERIEPSAAADVYSLASTLYTAMEGAPPFERLDGEGALTFMHRVQETPCPSSAAATALSPELDALLRDAMAKDPADRPALDTFVAGLAPFAAAADDDAPRAPSPRRQIAPISGTPTGEPEPDLSAADPADDVAGSDASIDRAAGTNSGGDDGGAGGDPVAGSQPAPDEPARTRSGSTGRKLALALVAVAIIGGLSAFALASRNSEDDAAALGDDPTADTKEAETTTSAVDAATLAELATRPSGASNARPLEDPGMVDTSAMLRADLQSFAATSDSPAVRGASFHDELDGPDLKFGSLPALIDYSATNRFKTDECLSIYLNDLAVSGAAGAVWSNGTDSVGLNAIEFDTEDQAQQAFWAAALFNGLSDQQCSGWPPSKVAIDPTGLSVDRQDFPLDAHADDLVTAIDDSPYVNGLDMGIQYQMSARVGSIVVLANVSSTSGALDPAAAGAVLDAALQEFARD